MTKCTLLSGSQKLISNKQKLKCSRKPPTELFSTRRKFSRSVSSLVTMVSNFFVEFMSTITRSDVEVEKVVRTFLKGAYLKRCHKTIKGFSYDPLWVVVLVLHSLRIFHILASILAPMSRNDIDAIGDKFCPLSKDQVLELGLHTLWQKKISEKDEKF